MIGRGLQHAVREGVVVAGIALQSRVCSRGGWAPLNYIERRGPGQGPDQRGGYHLYVSFANVHYCDTAQVHFLGVAGRAEQWRPWPSNGACRTNPHEHDADDLRRRRVAAGTVR